jgi:hypothetical protein
MGGHYISQSNHERLRLVPVPHCARSPVRRVPDAVSALRAAAARRSVEVQVRAPGEWVTWAT